MKYPNRAKIGSRIAAPAAAVAPGLSTTAPALPRIVASMLVDAANTGMSPKVTRIAPTDCVKESAWPDSARKNGGTVTKRRNIEALVRLPDQIGWPVTWDKTWYPTPNISASGTHPDAIISATQTVPVQPSVSPITTANLLNSRVNKPKIKNQDGTEIGELPRLPIVINEFTNRLNTSIPEINP